MSSVLESIDRVHSAAGECVTKGIVTHRVRDILFHRFSSSIRVFEAHLKETDTLENWESQLGYLKVFRLKYATSIVSARELCNKTRLRGSPTPVQTILAGADSATVILFNAVDDAFKALQIETINPLLKSLVDLLSARDAIASDALFSENSGRRPKKIIALLCQWNDLYSTTNSLLREYGRFKNYRLIVVKPLQLKGAEVFDEILVFGSWRWIERKGLSYIFRAPRCKLIEGFCFNAIPDYLPQFYQLAGSPHRFQKASDSKPRISHPGFSTTLLESDHGVEGDAEKTEVATILDEMLPFLDLGRVSSRTGGLNGEGQAESVEARLAELSGNSGVWLSEDGMVYKMQLEHSSGEVLCKRVRHVDVSEVEVGDVLIFSTAGGGDMILDEANLLMGKSASAVRQTQLLWKRKLRDEVRMAGSESFCRSLRASGVTSVSLDNLRNWMNPANIAPANRDDFIIILEKCGLLSEVGRVITATDFIRRAHSAAGFSLSRRLVRMIQGETLNDLASAGFQVFGGTETITSEKTAFTVESISSGTKCVDSGVINKPFTLDEDLWR